MNTQLGIEYTVLLAAMFARSTQGSVSTHMRPVHVNVQTVSTVDGRGACGKPSRRSHFYTKSIE